MGPLTVFGAIITVFVACIVVLAGLVWLVIACIYTAMGGT